MRQVAEHTSVAPSDRIRRLQSWRERLMTIPEVSLLSSLTKSAIHFVHFSCLI